jgi:anthranilate synthase component 2
MKDMSTTQTLSVLFIDNFDSFVFNLVDEFCKRDCRVAVWRNDISAQQALQKAMDMPAPRLVVLSPGPGNPRDAGCCIELLRTAPASLPIFGVCLGHQAIVEALGGRVIPAGTIVHGKSCSIDVAVTSTIFAGLSSPMTVGRYHSLTTAPDPAVFDVTASYRDIVMAVTHRTRPVAGVQFHPESILTPQGGKMIDNLVAWAIACSNAADGEAS